MTAGWNVTVPEPDTAWRTCVLCGAVGDAFDVRPSMWPVRGRPKGEAWQSGQRCVDHMGCRIRMERSGRTWPVDDRTPPSRLGQPAPDEPASQPPARGEVEQPGSGPAAPAPSPAAAPDPGPEPDWSFD